MIHPIIRLQVAQLLHQNDRSLTAKEAVEQATKLIRLFQDNGLDIVRGEWMTNGGQRTRFEWGDIAKAVSDMEAEGRTPWDPPELH